MRLGELLRQKRDAIVQRWLDGVLASYPGDSAATFKSQKDPFANPVGHSLRVGTQGVFEAILNGMETDKIRGCLHEIIRIRSVQEFSASQAVCFVFDLKQAIRAELGKAASEPRLARELAELDERIDRISLVAFDVFVECRERVCELRINEAKRRVSWLVEKMNERGLGEAPPERSGDRPL